MNSGPEYELFVWLEFRDQYVEEPLKRSKTFLILTDETPFVSLWVLGFQRKLPPGHFEPGHL